MATFASWLLARETETDPGGAPTVVARLAAAWRAAPDRGTISSPSGVKRYITQNWAEGATESHPDVETALGWLDMAVAEMRRDRGDLRVVGAGQSAVPLTEDRRQVQLDAIEADVRWLRAAITLMLPDEALAVLEAAAEAAQDDALDFAGMWAKADKSDTGSENAG